MQFESGSIIPQATNSTPRLPRNLCHFNMPVIALVTFGVGNLVFNPAVSPAAFSEGSASWCQFSIPLAVWFNPSATPGILFNAFVPMYVYQNIDIGLVGEYVRLRRCFKFLSIRFISIFVRVAKGRRQQHQGQRERGKQNGSRIHFCRLQDVKMFQK